MKPRLIRSIDLDNGLKLKLFDESSRVAGDRWRVALIAKIEIPIDNDSINTMDQPLVDINEISKTLGTKVDFEQERVRNFIAEKKKNRVLQNLLDSFLDNSLAYLARPDFPRKYVLKAHQKYMQKKAWYLQPKKSTRKFE